MAGSVSPADSLKQELLATASRFGPTAGQSDELSRCRWVVAKQGSALQQRQFYVFVRSSNLNG